MKINFRKRNNPNLMKITHVAANGDFISQENVLIEEALNNVTENGDLITTSILETINWRDEELLFSNAENIDTVEYDSTRNKIVGDKNGDIWVFPAGKKKTKYKLTDLPDIDTANLNYVAASGITYANSKHLEYYNKDKEMKMYAVRAKIGARPTLSDTDALNTTDRTTYMDIRNDGIDLYHKGKESVRFRDNQISFKYIPEGTSTSIYSYIDVNGGKFNCNTNLSTASYGSNNFRMQCYEDKVQFTYIPENKTVFKIDKLGNIFKNGSSYKLVELNDLNNYVRKDDQTNLTITNITPYLASAISHKDVGTLLYDGEYKRLNQLFTINCNTNLYNAGYKSIKIYIETVVEEENDDQSRSYFFNNHGCGEISIKPNSGSDLYYNSFSFMISCNSYGCNFVEGNIVGSNVSIRAYSKGWSGSTLAIGEFFNIKIIGYK